MVELTWKAIYNDGIELAQNSDNAVHKYSDIDRTKLEKFLVYKDKQPIFVLHLDSDKKLIFRRRVAKALMSGKEEVVYLVGWQENRNGVNLQSISFIFEDGHIEVVDRFKDGHPWFYPINFLDEEKI